MANVRIDTGIKNIVSGIYKKLSAQLIDIKGSTIFVAGGMGYVGSWLAEVIIYLNKYENSSINLYILDKDIDTNSYKYQRFSKDQRVRFIRSDVIYLAEIPKEVNYVINAAATPDSRYHVTCPIETMSTIAEGTNNLLRAAGRVTNLIKFLNISSSMVYENVKDGSAISELSQTRNYSHFATSSYSEAKRYGEALCAAARSEARIPVVTVRPFTFCGAYQKLDAPWALNNFINDALNNRNIRILGDGTSMRGLMYGADLAYWLLVIVANANDGDVFNVGSDQSMTVEEIAINVANHFTPPPSILKNTSLTKINERSTLVPDINMAKERLGLEVYTSIDQAIFESVEWYKANKEAELT